ncbi:protein lyk5 [Quercus suber]|uniref:Protein lyk5 n=1 Tax=Quercus suber TaxID=58331 RepID=A0AAW0KVH6_QUESU
MIYLWFVIWICINSCFAQQYYDPSDCSSEPRNGSRYECQYSFQNSCTTFLVYRANRYFQTISSISDLFNLYSTEVLQQNSVTSSDEILKPGREVLVPINCFCSDPFFQANVSYKVLSNTTFSEIACGVLEGLLKSPILSGANPSQGKEPEFGSELQVPLRCARPDNFTTSTCSFGCMGIQALKKLKGEKFMFRSSLISCSQVRSSPRSANSCLSPDILVEINYSLFMYSIEDLKKATRDFSEENKIGGEVYKGLINNVEVMIQPTRFENTRWAIDLHSKINHINIVNLHGVCYGEGDFSCSYLVFEFPSNGCLRHCLSNPLQWHRRTQIAFDIATGLHYLHYCTFLPLAHLSLSSTNIFVTTNWRAKRANIGTSAALGPVKEMDSKDSVRGWVAPEYLHHGSTSEMVDIFSFGVILLELISAWEDLDGKSFKESITFLGGASEGYSCFKVTNKA